MVFTTERFFEEAIESWPEWDFIHTYYIHAIYCILYIIIFMYLYML